MLRKKLPVLPLILTITLLISACSSSKKTTGTVDRDKVKGSWLLDNITFEGLPQGQKLKLTLLDEGDENCLKGSTWVFPNNGNGSYTIVPNSSGCTTGQRNIVWSYREENGQNVLQYKRLPGGVQAKDVTEGYKFDIVSATATNLSLQSKVAYEGSTISINYSFSKK